MRSELRVLDDDVPLVHGPAWTGLEFRAKFFPGIDHKTWSNWKWQIRNSITDFNKLSQILELNADEKKAFTQNSGSIPLRITPYYLSLLYGRGGRYPLKKTMVPSIMEHKIGFGESGDPLCEEHMSPVPNIVHRYPDRVLFLATEFCSAYCRYCTRHRVVGKESEKCRFNSGSWDEGISYIASNKQIRDVLISGGDPLTMSDAGIDYLLSRLRAIPHVQIIRIGTKTPAVLPQRITPRLIRVLKKYHPLYISIHFTHPDEITPETSVACKMLADAGIVLGSQTVLLKGVNDNEKVLTELFQRLLMIRVRPYYLYQCDPVQGTEHFRTSVEKGLEIMSKIRGHTSGYAVPNYVIDAPGGGGKIPLLPEYYQGRDEEYVFLRNFEGNFYKYPDLKTIT